MSYLDDPATKRLATHCAICGRALRDAYSVEAGIGPDCREKHGFDIEVNEEVRDEANRLIHQIAVDQHVGTSALLRLAELGFQTLVLTIEDRFAAVKVTNGTGGTLEVKTGYNPDLIEAFHTIRGARWIGERKVWAFPVQASRDLMKIFKAFFAGSFGVGRKGPFEIGRA